MASPGYVDTLYTLPSGSAWTLVEVEADNTGTPLHHYAYVYDGSGNLTTYIDKVTQGTISHTPPTGTYIFGPTLYNSSTAIIVRRAVTLEPVAFTQTDVDNDYALYFGSSGGTVYNMSVNSETIVSTAKSANILSDTKVSYDISVLLSSENTVNTVYSTKASSEAKISQSLSNNIASALIAASSYAQNARSTMDVITSLSENTASELNVSQIGTISAKTASELIVKATVSSGAKSGLNVSTVSSAEYFSEANVTQILSALIGSEVKAITIKTQNVKSSLTVSGLTVYNCLIDAELIVSGRYVSLTNSELIVYDNEGFIEEIVLKTPITIEKKVRTPIK